MFVVFLFTFLSFFLGGGDWLAGFAGACAF